MGERSVNEEGGRIACRKSKGGGSLVQEDVRGGHAFRFKENGMARKLKVESGVRKRH